MNFLEEKELSLKNNNKKSIILVCTIIAILIYILSNIIEYFIIKESIDSNFYHIKNFIMPITIILGGYIFLIVKNKMVVNKKAFLFLIPVGLILIGSIILNIPFNNQFLNIFIISILSSMFLLSLTVKNFDSLLSPIKSLFKLFPKNIFKNLKLLRLQKEKKEHKVGLSIFYGLLIGIPIAIIIVGLLMSADRYFGELVTKIIKPFWDLKLTRIGDVINIGITFLLSFSIFINILKNKKLKNEITEKKDLNKTTSITILSIVNLVFLIFIFSEISKLTNNFLQLPVEYTFANYAREGFFQLLLITAINFIIIGYHTYKVKGFDKSKVVKTLLLILIGFSIILIFNSYYRMFLYIGAYGFTTLRMQVLLFLLMELILFSIYIKKVIEKEKHNYVSLFVIIAIAFYVLNIYLANSNFLSLLK